MIYHDEYIVESFSTTTTTKLIHFIKWFPNKEKRSVGYHELTTLYACTKGIRELLKDYEPTWNIVFNWLSKFVNGLWRPRRETRRRAGILGVEPLKGRRHIGVKHHVELGTRRLYETRRLVICAAAVAANHRGEIGGTVSNFYVVVDALVGGLDVERCES